MIVWHCTRTCGLTWCRFIRPRGFTIKRRFWGVFRQQPFKNGYAVLPGLERIVSYLEDLCFSDSDIAWPRGRWAIIGHSWITLPISSWSWLFVLPKKGIWSSMSLLCDWKALCMSVGRNGSFEHRQHSEATKGSRIRSVIEKWTLDGVWDTSGSKKMDAAIWEHAQQWLVVPMEPATCALVNSLTFHGGLCPCLSGVW